MGKYKNIIEKYKIDDFVSLSILYTYEKIKANIFKGQDLSYLNADDIKNIENFYSAAVKFSYLGMFSEEQKFFALKEIKSLIGSYHFSIDMYRFFVEVYNMLLIYKMEVELDNSEDLDVSPKLA